MNWIDSLGLAIYINIQYGNGRDYVGIVATPKTVIDVVTIDLSSRPAKRHFAYRETSKSIKKRTAGDQFQLTRGESFNWTGNFYGSIEITGTENGCKFKVSIDVKYDLEIDDELSHNGFYFYTTIATIDHENSSFEGPDIPSIFMSQEYHTRHDRIIDHNKLPTPHPGVLYSRDMHYKEADREKELQEFIDKIVGNYSGS